jgi:hypothetical protein
MDWQAAFLLAEVNWQPWFMLGLVALVFVGLAMNFAADALIVGAAVAAGLAGIIRDRIRDMKKRGLSIQQVKADRPTLDFDGIYGSPDGFIDAVYRTLQ